MGDETDDKFETLYAYFNAIVSFLKGLRFSHEEARDLAQDVFLRVFQHMDTFRGEARWSYLTTVARRHALNIIRAKHTAKRSVEMASDDNLVNVQSQEPGPYDRYTSAEAKERLYRAIEQLEHDSQVVVRLQLSELSYGEMAEFLGISESAVKSRLYVARARLRELLGEDPDGLGGE